MLPIDAPRSSQPQGGAPLDLTHPLAAALDYLWLGGDLLGRDLIAGVRAPPPSACVLSPRTQGVAVASTSYATGTAVATRRAFSFPYVQVGYGYFTAAAANYTLSYLSGTVGTYNSSIQLSSSTQVRFLVQLNGTSRNVVVTLGTSQNTPVCAIAVVYSATDWRFFCNGQQVNGTLSPGTGTSMNRVYPIGHQIIGGVWLTGYGFGRSISDALALKITQSPDALWEMFSTTRQTPESAGGGGGTVIAGNLGTASASGFQGTVNANRTIAGNLGTAVASGFQGTVTTSSNTVIAGNLGTADAIGYTGFVNANRTVAGNLGTAVASGFQGTVSNSNDTVIAGNLGTAAAIGYTGFVNANRTIPGNLGVAVASGFTGTVTSGGAAAYTANANLYLGIGSDLSLMLGNPRMPSWNTAGRPGAPLGFTFGFNTDTNAIEVWNGSTWI